MLRVWIALILFVLLAVGHKADALDRSALQHSLMQHEGIKTRPYRDPSHGIAIGIGRNLTTTGITMDEALYLLNNDIDRALGHAEAYPWFARLSDTRQQIVVEMIFNLGPGGFAQFKTLHGSLARGDYPAASRSMLGSKWARQTGRRARTLAARMRGG